MLEVLGGSVVQWLAVAGLVLLAIAVGIFVLLRRSIKFRQMILAAIAVNALLASPILIVAGGYSVWFRNRPQPAAAQQPLFKGVTYTREVRQSPRPLIIHVVAIDMTAPDIRFQVTPGEVEQTMPFVAQTTSQYLAAAGAQIAVNGSFFYPYYSNGPWNFYPHVGDRVNTTGISFSEGKRSSFGNGEFPVLYLSSDNQPSLDAPDTIFNAISGNEIILRDGKFVEALLIDPASRDPQPRTALGYSADKRTLFIVCVDGRQPNFSEGVTLAELADILIEHGAAFALTMDSGGSTTLVAEGTDGKPQLLNTPIDNYLPGRERPIANHLGVFAASAE